MQAKQRIIVTGYVGSVPVGGVAWDYLQYVLGLARLGHDVYYHEETQAWPYDPVRQTLSGDHDYSARYIDYYFRHYAPELRSRWHYVHPEQGSAGMTRRQFEAIARSADIFLNVSGSSSIPQELSSHCLKIFLDTDPGYNHILMRNKMDREKKLPGFIRCYDQHFTYAENIGNPTCLIPDVGVRWKTTRMPIVLGNWASFSEVSPPSRGPWTTVMTWIRLEDKLRYQGASYFGKSTEMERFFELPKHTHMPIALALGGTHAPKSRLLENKWILVDGPEATRTPQKYQEFIANSRGEISVAKHVYVALRTGWFSSRSACYLAASRPVVVQDTGFSEVLPLGEGVVAFNTLEEAVEGIRRIESDYQRSSVAARRFAEEWFDSDKVLRKLIDDIME